MRKLLLASLAALGATVGMANAATLATTKPSTEPGSVTVNFNGLFVWYAGVAGSSADNVGGGKSNPYAMQGYVRLYPGFDGVMTNGLKYGAQFEVRINQPGTVGPSPGGNSTAQTLYVRRGYAYLGSPTIGTFRFGPHYGPSGLFLVGTFEGFDDGGWNGDVPTYLPGATEPAWPFEYTSVLYSANKVVYLSPSFAGFDFGVSFAPNTGSFVATACNSAAQGGCDRQSTSLLGSDAGRRENMVEAQARYQGTFGGVGIAAAGGFIGSGIVKDYAPGATQFQNESLGNFGATLSYAGFTVGGHMVAGKANNGFAPLAKGQKGTIAWLVGAQYQTGPYTVGFHYFDALS
ncbi:MAG: porin, partial [Rhodospirillales bacterium]|nr:porin [Rhodospirillales bacterium]